VRGTTTIVQMQRSNTMHDIDQKITPFLWFDNQPEEAANFYTSIFKNSKLVSVTRYEDEGAEASGKSPRAVMTVTFQLNGQELSR
jgi:predicted 3-demethylubiquinone-9 3-methyltransferase (glyoxalase superfamily)